MSLFHFHVTQIKRSAGQSAVACAAYRAGEKLRSEYYGEVSDYTRKGGVVESGIMLPEYVPKNLSDRETLWNEVEKIEKGKKAQLAYSFDFALQNEFTMEEITAVYPVMTVPKATVIRWLIRKSYCRSTLRITVFRIREFM
ncbi:MAG: MobA/MobL family protein [Clostridia bacterium]|nr:MobA/MobL family protein [Clostridia bacterium]